MTDYINFYKEIYDTKIKTMVNDVHRTIKIEDEYLEYSRQLHEDDGITEFMLNQAILTTASEKVKAKIEEELERFKVVEEELEEVTETETEEVVMVTDSADETNTEIKAEITEVTIPVITEETDVIVNVDGTVQEVTTNAVEIVEEHFELDGLEDLFDETEIKTDTDAEAV